MTRETFKSLKLIPIKPEDAFIMSQFEEEIKLSRSKKDISSLKAFQKKLVWNDTKASSLVDQVEMFNSYFASIASSSLSGENDSAKYIFDGYRELKSNNSISTPVSKITCLVMFKLENMYKTGGQSMEDLANSDGSVETRGGTPDELIKAVYIDEMAYGVHEIIKPTIEKIIATVAFLSMMMRRPSMLFFFFSIC
ncbi:hypothetical protein BpHYR1_016996 [Brachionus plicatilis]|uniref:Uncharacterized protein n=1 Tax=Brachionus plicatilis TaxID=10195 RepID=A0A3M7T7E3_BRAPC|nr:hypothetical protein BpHYR1_016996 [Brachionus plicatilis]